MISIAMTTYNGGQYICKQIDSIINQTFQDFELVVCDDCSTDDTISILNEYAQKDERIHVYVNEHNLGFKKNFELAIKKTSGEFIALCDQDDIWLPNHIDILLSAMNERTQIVCGKPIFVDDKNEVLPDEYNYLLMYRYPKTNEDIARHIFLGRSTYQGASMLIRKSFFDKALPIPDGAYYHDSWFAILACFMNGFIYIDEPTMRYRRLSDSITSKDIRISAAKRFCASIVYDYTTRDRLALIHGIRDRLKEMSPTKQSLLNKMETMIRRDSTLFGRIANIFYKAYHFKAIFACDIKHLFS